MESTTPIDAEPTPPPARERTAKQKRADLDKALQDPANAGKGVREIARLVRVDPSWVSSRHRELLGVAADPEKAEAGKRGNTARQKGKAAAAEPTPFTHPCG